MLRGNHFVPARAYGLKGTRRGRVPYYVSLIRWTDQGIKNVKESPKRAEAAHKLAEAEGGKLTLYYTMGRYDLVAIGEARDDETMNRVLLRIAQQGSVRTETLKAMTEAEAAKMLGKLP
jgi:uncharacterized protein with GYD domain